MIAELLAAIRFLTIVPAGDAGGARFGAVAFPIVGFFLGLGAIIVDAVFGFAGSPLTEIAILLFWILATGAIHDDGLADSCDGLGGRTPEDRLRLMAEGSIGTFGVLGLLVAFSTRLGALVALADSGRAAALLVAPMLGRAAMLFAAHGMSAARPGGLGESFLAAVDRQTVLRAGSIAGVVAVAIAGWSGIAAAVVVALATLGIRGMARRRLGGTTGDVIGASGLVAETLALAVFAAGARG